MNVLVVHNYYQQAGGEDEVFRNETQTLAQHGVQVSTHTVHNDAIGAGRGGQVRTALQSVWNAQAARTLAALVRERQVDVVHFHNTFPLISPAAYRAVRGEGAAVVQTLHNYRLLCANHNFFRDGHVCEDCLGRTPPWPAVRHACYRGSRSASGTVAAMLTAHRLLGTYARDVDLYVALTEFARAKLVQGGLPADRMVVKPNFLARDPGMGRADGDYALFVGRLTPEKGPGVLLEAWRTLGARLKLKVVGDGPLAPDVQRAAQDLPGVEVLGRQDRAQVLALMQGAFALVFPSLWFEGFPMTLVEAMAAGAPIVASRLGSMPDIVEHGHTGRLFDAGRAEDLAAQLDWLLDHPLEREAQRLAARRAYEAHYTEARGAQDLLDVYARALTRRRTARGAPTLDPSTPA